jgi:hypothetical protein
VDYFADNFTRFKATKTMPTRRKDRGATYGRYSWMHSMGNWDDRRFVYGGLIRLTSQAQRELRSSESSGLLLLCFFNQLKEAIMPDAIQIQKVTIKCGSCDFQEEGSVTEWHGKPCPQCGNLDVVTDKDLELYNNIMSFSSMVNALAGDVDGHSVTATFDSAGFKKT